MAEFIGVEEKAINAGDPLIFENKTDCSYDVSAGIVFHKSGIYKVSIDGNKTIITLEQPTYTDAEIQKIQDLEQAQLEKAYQLGYAEAKKDAQQKTIRCKDCMHRPIKKDGYIVPPGPEYDDWKCPFLCDDPFYSRIPGDNFYCANGERREE